MTLLREGVVITKISPMRNVLSTILCSFPLLKITIFTTFASCFYTLLAKQLMLCTALNSPYKDDKRSLPSGTLHLSQFNLIFCRNLYWTEDGQASIKRLSLETGSQPESITVSQSVYFRGLAWSPRYSALFLASDNNAVLWRSFEQLTSEFIWCSVYISIIMSPAFSRVTILDHCVWWHVFVHAWISLFVR